MELLLLVLFVVRSIIRFLRSVIGDQVILSLSPAQEEPTLTPACSPPALLFSPLLSSLRSPVSKAVRFPQVLLINPLGLEPLRLPLSLPSSLPSFPPDKIANKPILIYCELLEIANGPISTYYEFLKILNSLEDINSIKVPAKYGLLPNNTLLKLGSLPDHTSLEPSPLPLPVSLSSPSIPSSPPNVPPQLYTAPAASSTPPHVPRQAPTSSSTPR
jgi:hypothetical protein